MLYLWPQSVSMMGWSKYFGVWALLLFRAHVLPGGKQA